MNYIIREIKEEEYPILSDFLYEAIFIPESMEKPPKAIMNSTPFVRQYGILSNKWGVLLCQKEYQTNDIRQNSKSW